MGSVSSISCIDLWAVNKAFEPGVFTTSALNGCGAIWQVASVQSGSCSFRTLNFTRAWIATPMLTSGSSIIYSSMPSTRMPLNGPRPGIITPSPYVVNANVAQGICFSSEWFKMAQEVSIPLTMRTLTMLIFMESIGKTMIMTKFSNTTASQILKIILTRTLS